MLITILVLSLINLRKELKEIIEVSAVSMKMMDRESKPLDINRIVSPFCMRLVIKQRINISIKRKSRKFTCYCPDSTLKLRVISLLLSTIAGAWSTTLKR